MAIPKFEDFLYPFLLHINDKAIKKNELKAALIKHFNLTEEDCDLKTKGGSTRQLDDRIGWSLQYFRRALFVDIPQRGVYQLTQRGKDFLKNHTELKIKDLLQYPEFAEYSNSTASTTTTTTDSSSSTITTKAEELTPTEQIETAFNSINDDLAAELLQKVLEMSPHFFEQLVLDLLLQMGYGGNKEMAKVTPISHDNGIDGIIPEDALGLDKIYIQAKRYRDTTVGKPEIQQFVGAIDEQKANKGVFITTSKFSQGARDTAEKANKRIVLLDGKELTEYMIKYNVGVSVKKAYEVKKIDLDYFEE